ncbi:39851_t:CDS:2 [Gigaspora margarita]|uniref:39851_t:CDS:1 n=1 Tax=Gigaspora margarita TaxID=4874 RepID=A0ABN7UYC8_GIGMA|nr:39851_t:CDS:2 [Gigaspora margarita]
MLAIPFHEQLHQLRENTSRQKAKPKQQNEMMTLSKMIALVTMKIL